MLNRKNKKGFTLAELLIVVAIIAVLVAIAVPLFVGALDDAQKKADAANIRSLRAAAVSYILTVESTDANYTKIYCGGADGAKTLSSKGYTVTAELGEKGDFTNFDFTELTDTSTSESVKKESSKTTVTCIVKPTDLKKATS